MYGVWEGSATSTEVSGEGCVDRSAMNAQTSSKLLSKVFFFFTFT